MAFTVVYLKKLAEDAVSAFAAGALGVLGAGAVNVVAVDWSTVGGVGLGAALVMVLKGLASKGVGSPDSTHVSSRTTE